MDAGFVQRIPEQRADDGVGQRAIDVRAAEQDEHGGEHAGYRQPSSVEGGRIEQRDDDDRDQVVDDHGRRQEYAQVDRHAIAQDDDQRDRERRVRRHRQAPRVLDARRRKGEEQQRRRRHAADRGGERQRGGTPRRKPADAELALDLEADDEEEDRQRPVVHPVDQGQRERVPAEAHARLLLPQRQERGTLGAVADRDREQRHQQQQHAGGRRPAREIEARRLQAMPERTQHRFAERGLVPRALVATAVDEERGGDAGAAFEAAARVAAHAGRDGTRTVGVPGVAGRHVERLAHALEVGRLQVRCPAHQLVVRLPEAAGRRLGVLDELRGARRLGTIGERQVAVDVAHPVAKAVAQTSDDVVRRAAVTARVASVLDQRDRRVDGPDDVV